MRLERDEIRTSIVLVVLAGAFVLTLYLPHRKQMAQTAAEIKSLQTQLQAEPDNTRHLAKLAEEVESLKQSLSGAQQYVPPQSELAALLKQLSTDLEKVAADSRAEGAGVRGQETQTQAIANFDNYSILPVGMRFQTTFASAFEFLKQIEAMPRLVRVDVLELSWKNQSSEEPVYQDVPLDVRLSLSAFFSPSADLPALGQ